MSKYDSIPTHFLGIPALIESSCGGSGSGFSVLGETHAYLVTASHVIFDGNGNLLCDEINAKFWLYDPTSGKKTGRKEWVIKLSELENKGFIKRVKGHDICAIQVGEVVQGQKATFKYGEGVTGSNVQGSGKVSINQLQEDAKFENLNIGNEAFITGYPKSIGFQNQPQFDYEMPLLRKGIIAGKNEQQKTLILDCPAYPGNSGGPVIEIYRCGEHCRKNHFQLVGVVSQFIPFAISWTSQPLMNTRTDVQNSGYSVVVPIDTMLQQIQ